MANKFIFHAHHIYIVAAKHGCVFCGTALSERSCADSTNQPELLVNAGKCAAVDRTTWHVVSRTEALRSSGSLTAPLTLMCRWQASAISFRGGVLGFLPRVLVAGFLPRVVDPLK